MIGADGIKSWQNFEPFYVNVNYEQFSSGATFQFGTKAQELPASLEQQVNTQQVQYQETKVQRH